MNDSSSFIPKQTPATSSRRVIRKRIYVMTYVAYVACIGTLLVSGGVTVWKIQLEKTLEEQKAILIEKKDTFSQSDIAEVRELDGRIDLAEYILNQQPAISRLLLAVSETTLQNVQLETFSVSKGGAIDEFSDAEFSTNNTESSSDDYTLTYGGKAPNFAALQFQREVIGTNDILADVIISSVEYGNESAGEEGAVQVPSLAFEFTATLPVAAFAYEPNSGQQTSSFVEPEVLSAPPVDTQSASDSAAVELESLDEDSISPMEEENIN